MRLPPLYKAFKKILRISQNHFGCIEKQKPKPAKIMDLQAQLQRTHGHHQAEEPIRIHHPEEEEHHKKGPSKVLKKVKEKAKKIKNVLTKNKHGHEHDRREHIPDDHDLEEENDEDVHIDQQIHGGAPGTKAFPVVSSPRMKSSVPIRGVEPVHGSSASHGHEALSRPVRSSGVSEKQERRGASALTPHNTPVSLLPSTEDVTRTFVPAENKSGDQRKVNIQRPKELEEDSAAPGSHGMSNYQSKVTDPTGKASGEIGAASTVAALGRLELRSDQQEKSYGLDTKSRPEMDKHLPAGNYGSQLGKEVPARSHEFDVRARTDLGKDLPTGTQGIQKQNPEGFDSKAQGRGDEMQQPDKIALATSTVADKAVAAKNAVTSKLGYSGEGGHENRVEEEKTPSSAGGYGSKVAGMVAPVYEKVKDTRASVMTKLPLSGSGIGTETGQNKGVSPSEYMSEKLSPGEEDKVLSKVVAEKLHLGGGGGGEYVKKGTVTQSEEVEKRLGGFRDPKSEEAMKHGEAFAEEGEGGMVEKLRGAVTSWLAGTTDEVTQKSTESVQDSTQLLGSTVGNKMGIPGSGGDEAGRRGGDGGSVPLQSRFQESGK